MASHGDAIHKAKPVDQHKLLFGWIRQRLMPSGRLEGDQAVRSDMAGGFDGLGEAQEIPRSAA